MAERRPGRRRPVRKTRTVNVRRWTMAAATLLILVLAGGYIAIFSPVLAVTNVSVSGNQNVPNGEIVQFIRDHAEGRIGAVVSRSLAVVDTSQVEQQTKDKFQDLARVEVRKRWPNGLKVKVTERQQALLWQSNNQYFLVDKQGFAFQQSQPRADLVSVVDSTNLPVQVGRQVVGSSFIKVLDQIQKGMTEAGIPVLSFRIPETTFEIQAVTKDGWYALFDTTRNVQNEVDSLKQGIGTGKPKEYADLRVPGRVYIK